MLVRLLKMQNHFTIVKQKRVLNGAPTSLISYFQKIKISSERKRYKIKEFIVKIYEKTFTEILNQFIILYFT